MRATSNNFSALFKLADEMGVYLAFRQYERIARLWAELLNIWPDLKNEPRIQQLLQRAQQYNNLNLAQFPS